MQLKKTEASLGLPASTRRSADVSLDIPSEAENNPALSSPVDLVPAAPANRPARGPYPFLADTRYEADLNKLAPDLGRRQKGRD